MSRDGGRSDIVLNTNIYNTQKQNQEYLITNNPFNMF